MLKDEILYLEYISQLQIELKRNYLLFDNNILFNNNIFFDNDFLFYDNLFFDDDILRF